MIKPDNIKRILVLDDALDFNTHRSVRALRDAGIEAELEHWANFAGAFKTLEEWAAAGHRADVLSVDVCGGYHYMPGINHLEMLVAQIKEKLGEEFVPAQIFLHSADRLPHFLDTAIGSVPTLISQEFIGLFYAGKDEGGQYRTTRFFYDEIELRKFFNETWGADFPLSAAEALHRNGPEKPLDEFDACRLVSDGVVTPEEALLRVDLSHRRPGGNNKIDSDYSARSRAMTFEEGVVGAACGRVVFDAGDVQRLKAEDPSAPLILVVNEFEPNHAKLLQECAGIIVLSCKLTGHCRQLCENYGLPAAFNDPDDHRIENGPSTWAREYHPSKAAIISPLNPRYGHPMIPRLLTAISFWASTP